jgi:hypothetical protein
MKPIIHNFVVSYSILHDDANLNQILITGQPKPGVFESIRVITNNKLSNSASLKPIDLIDQVWPPNPQAWPWRGHHLTKAAYDAVFIWRKLP